MAPLLAASEAEAKKKGGKGKRKKKKITICHNGQTIKISKSARKAHLKHGDTLGPNCAGKQCGDDGCGGVCGSCGAVACVGGACNCAGQLDLTSCGDGRQCSGGVCATPPGCRNDLCHNPTECCSNNCISGITCNLSPTAGPCTLDADCLSRNCVGFKCQEFG